MTSDFTYSVKHIYAILESYVAVDAGAYDQDKLKSYNKRTRRDIMRPDFENCIVAKADIDCAIDKIGVPACPYCHQPLRENDYHKRIGAEGGKAGGPTGGAATMAKIGVDGYIAMGKSGGRGNKKNNASNH